MDVVTLKERLERRVGEVVRRVVAELPPDLRTLAESELEARGLL